MPTIYAIMSPDCKGNTVRPSWFSWPAVRYAANSLIAVNLLILGIQLSLTKFELKNKDVYFTAFLRLCMGPVIAYLLILLLRIEGVMAMVLLISSGLPTAVNTVLAATEFNNEPEFATQTVVVTTLFCLFTLPLVIYFARMIFWSLYSTAAIKAGIDLLLLIGV